MAGDIGLCGAWGCAGCSDGFWPALGMVPCLFTKPWEGEEEGCIPRDFLGFCCFVFFFKREWCCILILGLRVDSSLPLPLDS